METTTRKKAGLALVVFLIVMAALTMLSNTLQEMIVPVVTTTTTQRGALEHRVNADGTLQASGTLAVTPGEAARVTSITAKVGEKLAPGDPLMLLDYTDVLGDRYGALTDALYQMSDKRQKYDWVVADMSKESLRTLEKRQDSLREAEAKRDDKQAALDALLAAGADESELDNARAALESAQNTVDSRKRSLDQLTASREYVEAERALRQAEQSLDTAWRKFFDAYAKIDAAVPADELPSLEDVLREFTYGKSPSELIPYDPDERYAATLRSDISGEVLAINASVGETLNTNTAAMTIGDLTGGLSMTVRVDAESAEWMEVGDEAEVVIGDDKIACPIVSIRASTESPGNYEVELHIPEGYGSIGLRGSMRFSKRTANYDVLIPLGALHEDSQSEYVYVVEQQEGSLGSSMQVRRVDVYTLDKDATRAALQGGVTSRDVLALRSDRELSDGDRVRLEEE